MDSDAHRPRDGARVTETIVITESLGGSPLSRAGRAGELPQWFVPRPTTPAEWKRHAQRVIESVDAGWLDKLSPALAASGAAADRLKKSANGAGLVVTTGQQPGLFGGPLMSLGEGDHSPRARRHTATGDRPSRRTGILGGDGRRRLRRDGDRLAPTRWRRTRIEAGSTRSGRYAGDASADGRRRHAAERIFA